MADDSKHDLITIGHEAQTPADRRLALDACLTLHWPHEDVKKVQRRDTAIWHGWDMWRISPKPGGGSD